MDHVESVSDLEKHFKSLRSHLLYLEDPKFFEFPNDIKLYKGDTLVIEVCIDFSWKFYNTTCHIPNTIKSGYQKSAKPDVPHEMYTTIKEQVFPLGN